MAKVFRSVPLVALFGAVISLAASAPFLASTASAMETVEFPQAVARALAGNPFVSAAEDDAAAARNDVAAARGNLLPSLRFEEKFVRTSVPGEAFALRMNQEKLQASDFLDVGNFNSPSPRNDFIAALTLEQPLFAPRAWIGYGIARKESDARKFDLIRRREDAVFAVVSSYLDVVTARRFVEVADQGLSDAREHLRIAERLEAAGMGLSSDVLRAKVAVASAESGKVASENRLELARRGLSLAMGEPGAPPVDAGGPLPEFPDPETPPPGMKAADGRADLRAMSLRVENAGSGVLLRKSGYLPDVGFAVAYQVDGEASPFASDNRTWKVGVGLTWNLFDGMRREAELGKAGAERRRTQALYRGMRDRAAFEAAQAALEVREATLRAEIARASLSFAEEGVRLLKSRYENQLGRMADLLDAQTALDATRAEGVRAENDVRRSRARRLYAAGALLPFAAAAEGKEKNR